MGIDRAANKSYTVDGLRVVLQPRRCPVLAGTVVREIALHVWPVSHIIPVEEVLLKEGRLPRTT